MTEYQLLYLRWLNMMRDMPHLKHQMSDAPQPTRDNIGMPWVAVCLVCLVESEANRQRIEASREFHRTT